MKACRMLFLTLGVLAVLAAPAHRLQAQSGGMPPEAATSDVSSDATGEPEPQATTAGPPEQAVEEAETEAQTPSPEPLVTNRATPYLVNGALALLALMTVVFVTSFFREISRDRPEGIGIETSWGGFGGGLGGWKLSPSLIYLIASLVFGSLLCMTVVGLTEKDRTEESAPGEKEKKEDKPAENQQAKDGK